MNFSGPSIPLLGLLEEFAPIEAWQSAIGQARRSPMTRYKVGAAIWSPYEDRIISNGCSHPDITLSKVLASIHAEHHALRRSHNLSCEGSWIVIYTLNGKGGCAWSSRPCFSCATSLYNANIEKVIYPERRKDGSWIVQTEHPNELIERSYKTRGLFAREQRIPSPI